MNIFILNTGRCGSTTFIKACKHIHNFTSAHESLAGKIGEERFNYPLNHIEADNRLSWFLGKLDYYYGDEAIYVHLKRDINSTASSFLRRYNSGIMEAYRTRIHIGVPDEINSLSVALDYCNTVNSNIEFFLKDKSFKMNFSLENAKEDFKSFWHLIKAEGDLDAALSEFDAFHNSTKEIEEKKKERDRKKWKEIEEKKKERDRKKWNFQGINRSKQKLSRIARKLPSFIKNA